MLPLDANMKALARYSSCTASRLQYPRLTTCQPQPWLRGETRIPAMVRMESGLVTCLNSDAHGATGISVARHVSASIYITSTGWSFSSPINSPSEPPFSVSTRSASEDGQTGKDADQSSRAAAFVPSFQRSPFGLHESRIRHLGSDVSKFCVDC